MSNASWAECPLGFVYPDNPSDSRNIYVLGTSCAVACRRPYFLVEQYQHSDNLALIVSSVGLALGSLLLIFWSRRPKRHYLMTIYIVMSLLTSLSFLVIYFNSKDPMEKKMCRDNSIPLECSDGVSLCIFQGAAVLFFSAAGSFVWLTQTMDLYLTIVLGTKGTLRRYFYHYLLLIFAFPTVLVIVYASKGYLGSNGYSSYCLTGLKGSSGNVGFIYLVPIVIIMLLGTYFFVRVLHRLLSIWWLGPAFRRQKVACSASFQHIGMSGGFKTPSVVGRDTAGSILSPKRPSVIVPAGPVEINSNSQQAPAAAPTDRNPEQGDELLPAESLIVSTYREKGREITTTIVIYCLLFLLAWSYLVAFHIRSILETSTAAVSYNNWMSCVFSNYDGVSNASWTSICGRQAAYYQKFYSSWYESYIATITGQTVLVCVIFYREFVMTVKECWYDNSFVGDMLDDNFD